MPLTPLPQNNTKRYKFTYTVNDHEHVFQVRAGSASTDVGMVSSIEDLFSTLDPILNELTFTKGEVAADGSDIFVPIATAIPASVYGSGTAAGLLVPQFIAFQGRSSNGRKVRLSVYGITLEENDYRFQAGDSSDVDAAIDVLQASTNYYFSIDDIKPAWYNYANTGFNAYWQRNLRV